MSSPLISALGALPVFAAGLDMCARPHVYLGRGTPAATDPRTVRAFGSFFTLLGGATLALACFQLVTE